MPPCKISVCIPTYNCAAFIGETVESILSQRFSDFELLIIDNHSMDDTRAIVESYAQKDPRIRFIVNPSNLGMVENWNLCLAHARGEYVKFVFGDDLLGSVDVLELMASVLDANSSVSLVCSARSFIDERSHVLRVVSHFETGIMRGTDVINYCLARNKNLIGEPSVVMFRKSQAGRGFKVNYRQIVDLEMWFHLLEKGSLAYINAPLCSFRVHAQQQTAKNKKTMSDCKDVFFLREDYLSKEYVTLSNFMKKYTLYDHYYEVWRLFKKREISRDAAVEVIDSSYGFARFKNWLPLYKLVRSSLKVYRKLALISKEHLPVNNAGR